MSSDLELLEIGGLESGGNEQFKRLRRKASQDPIPEEAPKKPKMEAKMVQTYCGIMFSEENMQHTRSVVSSLLEGVRNRKQLKDEEDFLWISKVTHILPNHRNFVDDKDIEAQGTLSLFRLNPPGIAEKHVYNEQVLWLQRQRDGFSCSGASVFTCTAGYANVTPEKVAEKHRYISSNNHWRIDDEIPLGDLPIEGMGCLIYDTLGILPVVMCGRVAQPLPEGGWESMEEGDDLFNDEARFVKLMRIVRFASLCCNNPHHWLVYFCF